MNLNKIFILGNLTADPIIRALPSGQSVANFSVATNRVFYDKDRQKQEQAEFHNVVAFGRTAEIAQQYLKKGSMILIEGRIQTRNWQDSSGNKRNRTEIITERLQLGPRSASFQTSRSEFPAPKQNKIQKETSQEDIPIIEEDKLSSSKEPQASSTEKPLEDKADDKEQEIRVEDIPF